MWYLDDDTTYQWHNISSFADIVKTYAEFKTAVIELYPGTVIDKHICLSDLDALVRSILCMGIYSLADLRDFY